MKILFKSFLLIAVVIFPKDYTAQKRSDSIDTFISRKMKELKIPGLQLAIIRNDKIDKLSSYGLANIEHQVSTKNNTVFPINSMTKAFVGVAIMQLQEQGKLKTEDAISKYLTDIPDSWKNITFRQLLSNTSGLPNNIDQKEQILGEGIESKNWEIVTTLPMEFSPGEKFSYNQTGYFILGKIITQLSGVHFTKFIEDHQFKPSKMPATQFGDSNDIIENSAGAYSTIINNNGQWINDGKLHNAFATFPLFFRTATGILSSAEDLSQWLLALQEGKLLKDKKSITELFSTIKLNNGTVGGFNKLTNGYALGWPTVIRAEHPAAAPVGGMRSALFVYPQDHLSIIVLTNLQGSNPEWFIDEIAGYYIPDMKAENGFGLSPDMRMLYLQTNADGYQNVGSVYQKIKKKNKSFKVSEDEINSWGYQMVGRHLKNEALAVFKLNTELFPNSSNVFDSYGEILDVLGRKEEAISNYKKSLLLNPYNTNAANYLKDKK
ncbi:serine hydrolase domain-containing protein [Chryseobacterium vrystaatense]|uniref:CubicO group peptidase, beta-lactamase class C family n=1 Tax=Chryseobacterium vrystaatense TaxID=307480 RepID=A0A1M5BMK9_9FLAO|nr:serine hydrolase domain-containing protein [Chryseobacterium vrystaatense]SHF43774.1 CubicO group peptidase, beta-lactamase class C family [Chryseobacterium vrystaatense]